MYAHIIIIIMHRAQVIGGNMLRVFQAVEDVATAKRALEVPFEAYLNPTTPTDCRAGDL